MKNLNEQDALAREQALNPLQSFIVQAPAGSGKTELLIRRYLVLLAQVRFPEAIIAITFTRKAAAEMRERILNALEMAAHPVNPSDKDEIRRLLAKKVLIHNKKMNWNLLANPNRLRIQTIDGFCQTLTRQMPLLSSLSEQQTPTDNPEFLYRLAARELINSLETKAPWQKALLFMLKHLDNDFNYLETLLGDLLANREQWLPYLANHDPTQLRSYLEKNLHDINQACIEELKRLIPVALRQELSELLNFSNFQSEKKLIENTDDINFWKSAQCLLFTKSDEWRKKLSQTEGFPTSDKKNKAKKEYYAGMKQRANHLIQQLQNQSGLREAFIDLKNVPPFRYSDLQWAALTALFKLLPVLVAHLKLVFQQHQKVDYTEILLCALAALGDEESPSDLTLSLDYQIEHILVDEFQDTSIAQFQLIEKLINGWQIGDGRSLFLVGDPMQSIYRFRKAEVGLFLHVRQNGIANIPLQALTLSVNFRSNHAIITWINYCFSKVLPQTENINRGAITFSPAISFHPISNEKSVETIWFNNTYTPTAEANKIITIIQKIKRQNPQDSIAILVRARTHLYSILPALQSASIPYNAIEIETLAENSAVQDILALTRALLHLGDHISWLALLRSPFCGLDLCDLYQITQFTGHNYFNATIWQQLTCFENIRLRTETKQRCRRIVPILQQCLHEKDRLLLTVWIKKTWLALGGPTTLNNPKEISHIETYLNYLEKKIHTEGDQFDLFELEAELSKIVTQSNTKLADHVDIMTIHKAKGLEYDHVILPCLHRKGSHDKAKLWLHQERLSSKNIKDFLIAPIKASHEKEDSLYNYLLGEEKQKTAYELTRLLYVASTRAKKSLTLLGMLGKTIYEPIKPNHSNSLLHHLWSALTIDTDEILSFSNYTENKLETSRLVKRLLSDWKNPSILVPEIKTTPPLNQFTYQWTYNLARIIGTVIHRLLYQITLDGLDHWKKLDFSKEKSRILRLLEQNGILPSQSIAAYEKVKKTLKNVINDPKGRWILSQEHQKAYSEYALTLSEHTKLQNIIIDRTFIDKFGVRWIIDYKTTLHQGQDLTFFLNLEMQRHKKQLERYANAFSLDPQLNRNNGIQLALYFPVQTLWCEWEYTTTLETTSATSL
ncbi:MAG: UvrD-helicase domain-containing protein [Rickettsiella sp.]|nr:UvrD-helicase domain-containing protein [Rickettsiella sp.]